MAEVKHRCRLYYQFPAQSSARLEAQLAQALGGTDAACVLVSTGGASTDEMHTSHMVDLVQAQGFACLIENDVALAERLGADGVHTAADPEAYKQARVLLGDSASVGVGCGLSRHDAMLLAELGADYVAFGSDIDTLDQCADLIAWWAEIFVVPCVAWNVRGPSEAAKLASLGADFVAPSIEIWREDDASSLIAEIDSAIRQARRAA